MGLRISLCELCEHYRGHRTCSAFPKGIPDKILKDEHDHRRPYRGDHGILFQMREDLKGGYFDDLLPLDDV